MRCAAVLLLSLVACTRAPRPALAVAAAADLTGVLEPLGQEYEQERGVHVAFTFGASGLLERQLEQGAPFDLFLSADTAFAEKAAASGACDGATLAPYATGRLALWQPAGAKPIVDLIELAGLSRVAIANPDTAPYGRAARQALEKANVFRSLGAKLVLAENVRQALQVAQSGNAEAAIVSLPLARAATPGQFQELDADGHAPLVQALVVCRNGRALAEAEAFAARLRSSAVQARLQAHGFGPPP
ncbi:MAG: molybdate ABC transporter substrate-binding protein [Myxococcaceae bacterium]|nr:molybdate ABC transporter substrate-binding protein [Myxococcaceae bacterium]